MRNLSILGIGVCGPALASWQACRAALSTGVELDPNLPTELPKPAILSPREQRRASETVRLAVGAALEACEDAAVEYDRVGAVFASNHGEGTTTHRLLTALCDDTPLVSPTQFHNSVHNTPAGVWSIATGSRMPSTSLSAGEATVPAGIAKAMLVCTDDTPETVLVFYDAPMPEPLGRLSHVACALSVALVISKDSRRPSYGQIGIEIGSQKEEKLPLINDSPVARVLANPIAPILPLLGHVARGEPAEFAFQSATWPNTTIQYQP